MSTFIADWLNILLRWAHLVVGITWIGTSFYFIALDLSLRAREKMTPGVFGTAWQVHGGGFYHVEKFTVAPEFLPEDLQWFKWDAYLTWVTGFGLLITQYYFNASAYLIDQSILPMRPSEAILISVLSLVGGWFLYDWLCRSRIGQNTPLLATIVFVGIVGAAYGFTHVFSGRGAFIHVGALVGTIMACNVFMIIVPNQRKIVGALMKGEEPDGKYGKIGKQRSVHNNYLTLPVLLMMVSNHYPLLTGHSNSWLIVALILIIGAMVRHFINRHEAGDHFKEIGWTLPVAAIGLMIAIVMTAPRTDPAVAGMEVSDTEVMTIVGKHCVMCHADHPAHEGFDEPPKGVVLTSVDKLRQFGPVVEMQAVKSNTMPLGNETGMTEEERQQLGAWIAAQ
ncbi:putative membrane protein [Hartmannibacter diazotrophicus]|uniref:Putative membrane protein n=1 Tax=Hartmannibacter diazotrophicus TaxID=1482074 RepID=A0A2C9D839_9HYPH|nr:urate hydroxylase PuuD [Hartmannibacter diazotrophicus]SON56477.1 putative membrane protein [Hartmannibacter diazotrophicus]